MRLFDQKFGAGFLGGVPTQPGVYRLYDEAGALLYVGKAANLRRRLADHARSQPRALGLRESARLGAVCTIRWPTFWR